MIVYDPFEKQTTKIIIQKCQWNDDYKLYWGWDHNQDSIYVAAFVCVLFSPPREQEVWSLFIWTEFNPSVYKPRFNLVGWSITN